MTSPTYNFASHPLRHIEQNGHEAPEVVKAYHNLNKLLDNFYDQALDAIERYKTEARIYPETNTTYTSPTIIKENRVLLEREIDRIRHGVWYVSIMKDRIYHV